MARYSGKKLAELESSLRTFLVGKTGVKAIFGTSPTRIYVDRIDEKLTAVYPFAIIKTVFEAPGYAHDGALPDTGLYQIDVFSDNKTTVNSGTTAIRNELSGYSGALGSVTAGHAFIMDTRGDVDSDGRVFRRSTDVEIGQNG